MNRLVWVRENMSAKVWAKRRFKLLVQFTNYLVVSQKVCKAECLFELQMYFFFRFASHKQQR